MATPEENLAQSLAKLQAANRIDGTRASYRKDNPTEYTKVIAYLQGGSRPSGVTSDMGMGLMLAEDARRGLIAPAPPSATTGGRRVSAHHQQDYQPSVMQYGLGDYLLCGEWAGKQASSDLSIPVYPYSSAFTARDAFFTGLTQAEALAGGHELRDSGGNVIANFAYQPSILCDPGRPQYQAAWVAKVISQIRDVDGCEGVFIDDLVQSTHIGSAVPTAYPTQPSWRAAVEEWVSVVVPQLRSAGLKVMLNTGAWYPNNPTFDNGTSSKDWATTLGTRAGKTDVKCMIENGFQTIDGSNTIRKMGPEWFNNWDGWASVITALENAGLDWVGMAHAPAGDSPEAIYLKASGLLFQNRPGSSTMLACEGLTATPFGPLIRADLGKPLGAASLSGQLWSRNFERGSVKVNPWNQTASIVLT